MSVCVLTRVAQIITAVRRESCSKIRSHSGQLPNEHFSPHIFPVKIIHTPGKFCPTPSPQKFTHSKENNPGIYLQNHPPDMPVKKIHLLDTIALRVSLPKGCLVP